MTTTMPPGSSPGPDYRSPGRSSGLLAGPLVDLAHATVVDAIARHARERPDAPALLPGDQPAQSYAEFWEHASGLAAALAEHGVVPGDQVAIWATRTAPVVAAAVAVMALGAAYLPIDPTYPAARVRRILEVGAPRVMLCAEDGALAVGTPLGRPTVNIHAATRPGSALTSVARPEDVAYTVFTTGSTGLPKGVLVNHRSLRNYLGWAQELTSFEPGDATPCFASLGFDHAVTCLWLPLLVGGTVQLVPDSWDPRPWLAPRDRPFAFIKITPSHVRLFERIAKPDYRAVTRTVMFGGERLDAALVASLGARLSGVRLLNHYGPTEATVGCTAYRFDSDTVMAEGALPIGTPGWNSRAYVVDGDLRPLPFGEEGELVLAGTCVADGYLGGGEEDRARFVDESAVTGGGVGAGVSGGAAGGGATSGDGSSVTGAGDAHDGRAYRTGDRTVVRDGALHYLGRMDEQVKVRGYRIEIQEVHDLVVSVPGVLQAAVVVHQEGLGGLELFVVPAAGGADPVTAVLEHLRAHLPAAAVPGRVRVVPHLVANAHGKFDAAATRELASAPDGAAGGTGAGAAGAAGGAAGAAGTSGGVPS